MKIGMLGTGMVGNTLATKLVELGHEVRMGSRTAGNEKAREWVAGAGAGASEGSFADAAAFGEIVFNCTGGGALAGGAGGSRGRQPRGQGARRRLEPARLLGRLPAHADRLQHGLGRRAAPARVSGGPGREGAQHGELPRDGRPGRVPGDHVLFVAGDDAGAKAEVVALLGELGWPAARVIDLGGIEASRGTEMYLPLWVRLMGPMGGPDFNIVLAR